MYCRLVVFLIISAAGFVYAEDNSDESLAVTKIELLGGTVTRNDKLPGKPVVGIKFGQGSRFGDKYTHLLSRVAHLNRLHLAGLQITDACLKEVATFQTLTEVDVYKCPLVTDAGIQELSKLHNLTYLACMNCEQITDEVMQGMGNLTQLKTLYIGGKKFTDVGASRVSELKSLNELAISGQVTDQGLEAIASLPKLTTLYLGGTRVTDAGMAHLHFLEHLKTLGVGVPDITDTGLGEVAKLDRLTVLFLGGTQITDGSMSELKNLRNLKKLDLSETFISNDGLKELQNLPKLAELHLDGCQRITDAGVKKLQDALPDLRITR